MTNRPVEFLLSTNATSFTTRNIYQEHNRNGSDKLGIGVASMIQWEEANLNVSACLHMYGTSEAI